LEQACALKSEDSVYIAGGTDIVPALKYGLLFPKLVISLQNVPGLASITIEGGNLVIGAMVGLEKLARYTEHFPNLSGLNHAVRAVASPQIRHIGTVGGNLLQEARCIFYNQTTAWRRGIEPCHKTGGSVCHQAPAKPQCVALYHSDLAPAFLAADCLVQIYRDGNEQQLPLETLLAAPSRVLGGGVLTHIVLPDVENLRQLHFRKHAVRGAIDFPLANAALTVRACGTVRLIMGAMTPKPVTLEQTQSELADSLKEEMPLAAQIYQTAAAEAKKKARPIREATASPAVKQQAMVVVQEVIRDLL